MELISYVIRTLGMITLEDNLVLNVLQSYNFNFVNAQMILRTIVE